MCFWSKLEVPKWNRFLSCPRYRFYSQFSGTLEHNFSFFLTAFSVVPDDPLARTGTKVGRRRIVKTKFKTSCFDDIIINDLLIRMSFPKFLFPTSCRTCFQLNKLDFNISKIQKQKCFCKQRYESILEPALKVVRVRFKDRLRD